MNIIAPGGFHQSAHEHPRVLLNVLESNALGRVAPQASEAQVLDSPAGPLFEGELVVHEDGVEEVVRGPA